MLNLSAEPNCRISLHILRVLTGLEAGKAQVFSRNIKRAIARVLEDGHGGTVTFPIGAHMLMVTL